MSRFKSPKSVGLLFFANESLSLTLWGFAWNSRECGITLTCHRKNYLFRFTYHVSGFHPAITRPISSQQSLNQSLVKICTALKVEMTEVHPTWPSIPKLEHFVGVVPLTLRVSLSRHVITHCILYPKKKAKKLFHKWIIKRPSDALWWENHKVGFLLLWQLQFGEPQNHRHLTYELMNMNCSMDVYELQIGDPKSMRQKWTVSDGFRESLFLRHPQVTPLGSLDPLWPEGLVQGTPITAWTHPCWHLQSVVPCQMGGSTPTTWWSGFLNILVLQKKSRVHT